MARKIFVTSGKGGVGKSTITALLGEALADLNQKTLIIELDFGLRSLDIILGLQDKVIFDLNDVLMSKCNIDKAIVTYENNNNLKLISASLDYLDTYYYNEKNIMKLLEKIEDNYDYILLDSPAGVGKGFKEVLNLIDEALIVVTPDLVCVRDACKISQILSEYNIHNQRLVINKVKNKFKKLKILPDLDYVIDGVGVQLISVIPDNIDIMKSTAKGVPLIKGTLPFKLFDALGRRILGENVPLLIK